MWNMKDRTQTCESHSNRDLRVLLFHKPSGNSKSLWFYALVCSFPFTKQSLLPRSLPCNTEGSLFLRQTDRSQRGAGIVCSERTVYYSPISATLNFNNLESATQPDPKWTQTLQLPPLHFGNLQPVSANEPVEWGEI